MALHKKIKTFADLFSPVTVFLLKVPLERHMRRSRLALQERGTPLYSILNRLQSVLIDCRSIRTMQLSWRKINLSKQTNNQCCFVLYLPFELYPLHWRMGLPYFTSCRRLRLQLSEEQSQMKSLNPQRQLLCRKFQQFKVQYPSLLYPRQTLTSSVKLSIWSRTCRPRRSKGLWPDNNQHRPLHRRRSGAKPRVSRPEPNSHTVVAKIKCRQSR